VGVVSEPTLYGKRSLFFGDGLKALIDKHSNALSKEKNIYAGITRTRHGVALSVSGLSARWSGRYRSVVIRGVIWSLPVI
jgi:hypothetical protein